MHPNQSITASELDERDRLLFEQSGAQAEDEFRKSLGDKPLGVFVRSILGMDSTAARDAFSVFLSHAPLPSVQIEFLKDLFRLLTVNGRVNPEMLFEQPFKKFHSDGVAGVFSSDVSRQIIEIVRNVNDGAVAG